MPQGSSAVRPTDDLYLYLLVSLLLQHTCHDMFRNIRVLNVLWLYGVTL